MNVVSQTLKIKKNSLLNILCAAKWLLTDLEG